MLETRWHDDIVDPLKLLQLQDLASVLAKVEGMAFDISYGAFVDLETKRITASSLWDATENEIKVAGYKTDIYLRALGTLQETDLSILQKGRREKIASFTKQLFTLLEDLRLEEFIKRKRPGTKGEFVKRRNHLRTYFTSQLEVNTVRGLKADALFSGIYLLLTAEKPDISFPKADKKVRDLLERAKPHLYDTFSASTSRDIWRIVEGVSIMVLAHFSDLTNKYFSYPITREIVESNSRTVFDELTRTDDVENDDYAEMNEESDASDERLETWHDKQAPTEQKQTFLQMDLELGTKTNIKGETARQTESGDQVFATAQGTSQRSAQEDYSDRKTLEDYEQEEQTEQKSALYGKENIHAVPIVKQATVPSTEEEQMYEAVRTEVAAIQRKLTTSLKKVLEHNQDTPRGNFPFGGLSKNLLPIVFEDFPRLFYKKDEESKEFDAAFSLLVDCSASMDQKMDETKRGITLFHEVLRNLHIPHAITGFWEGATSTLRKDQPNYFHEIHTFNDSLYEKHGPKIMQLKPEEDNRDGFSIRVATEKLLQRREKHKFLLVFTDGEPAADNYYENGIVDTNEAVTLGRRQGIHILGMFLSETEVGDWERNMMESIYGREQLIIEHLAELPERLSPVLKKLLMQTVSY